MIHAEFCRHLRRPALLVVGLCVLGVALQRLPQFMSAGGLVSSDLPIGIQAKALFLGTAALFCAVGLPRQAVAFAAGYEFGLLPGLALAMAAQVSGCLADFTWARAVAREWTQRRLGPRLARLDRFLAANPFTTTLTLRLLPISNNLAVTLVAGVSSAAPAPFLLASAVGYVPQTIVFVLMGRGIRIEHTAQVVLAIGLFAASLGLGLVLLRRGVLGMQRGSDQ